MSCRNYRQFNDNESGGDSPGPGWLYTSGNKIFSSTGEIWIGRGANIQDTRGCNACAWDRPDVEEVKRRIDTLTGVWGASFIRLTLESYEASSGRSHWKGILEDPDYLNDIKDIVSSVGRTEDVYILLSLWEDPTFSDLGWPTPNTIPVWEKLVETFAHDSHVLYGIVNEPARNWSGDLDAQCWQAMNSVVEAIRTVESRLGSPKHIIAVQGTRAWSRSLDYYIAHPITAGNGENIVYETHIYDSRSDFEELFIFPSQHLPVIIGEFGPADGYMTLADCEALIIEAEKLKIPYLAWTFHMRCPPNLLVDHSGGGCGAGMILEPTSWGRLVMKYLNASSFEFEN